jgi:hypothetical protein
VGIQGTDDDAIKGGDAVLPAAAAEDDDDITDSDEDRKVDGERHTARVLRWRRRDTLRVCSDGEEETHYARAQREKTMHTARVLGRRG